MRLRLLFAASVFLLVSGYAVADDDDLQVHGYGSWIYGKTSGYDYLIADKDGNYSFAQMALAFSKNLTDDLRIFTQVKFTNFESDEETTLDYAFVEWSATDSLKLRFGKARNPFGLYSETFDVGTTRPFLFLPHGMYGKFAFAQYFKGIGLSGLHFTEGDWGFNYDLYFGSQEVEASFAGVLQVAPSFYVDIGTHANMTLNETFGGRAVVSTPIEGLSFGASGSWGKFKDSIDAVIAGQVVPIPLNELINFGLQAEYVSGNFWLRSEFGRFHSTDTSIQKAAYLELAYRLSANWQTAFRYEWADYATETEVPLDIVKSFLEHQEYALGLNYWFSSGFVLKFSFHRVEGNRLAQPGNPVAAVFMGTLEESTDVFMFGTQFSF